MEENVEILRRHAKLTVHLKFPNGALHATHFHLKAIMFGSEKLFCNNRNFRKKFWWTICGEIWLPIFDFVYMPHNGFLTYKFLKHVHKYQSERKLRENQTRKTRRHWPGGCQRGIQTKTTVTTPTGSQIYKAKITLNSLGFFHAKTGLFS